MKKLQTEITDLLNNKNYRGILRLKDQIILHLTSYQSYSLLAMAAFETGQYDKASEYLSLLGQLTPNDPDIWFNLGVCARNQGEYSSAIHYYNLSLNLDYDQFKVHFNLSNTHLNQGHFELALRHAQEALKLDTNQIQSLYLVGTIYLEQKDFETALAVFHKIIEKSPDHAKAQYSLGRTYNNMGNAKLAYEYYKRSYDLQPQDIDTIHCLANVSLLVGDLDLASTWFVKGRNLGQNTDNFLQDFISFMKLYTFEGTSTDALILADRKVNRSTTDTVQFKENLPKWTLENLQLVTDWDLGKAFPHSQLFRKGKDSLDCNNCMAVFHEKEIIPQNCFSCFKLQIDVVDFLSLVTLAAVFYDIGTKLDNTMKCMIELRNGVQGFYKGFIYCTSILEAQRIKGLLENEISKVKIGVTSMETKRGCSEFNQKFPGFAKTGANQLMLRPQEWSDIERTFNFRSKIELNEVSAVSRNDFCLADIFVLRRWLDYARGLGDPSISHFHEIPELHIEMKRAGIARRDKYQDSLIA